MKDTIHSFGRSFTPKTRLFCFPYAGGTTGIFRPWHSLLAPTIEVIGIRYRGRGARLCETPFRSISDIVEETQTEIADLLDEPYAIFGHSMGAMVAFDLARRLSTHPGRTPQHLFLSGLSAPHKRDPGKPIHDLPNDAFIEALGTLGGTPPDVLRNVELLDLLTPAIRADLEAAYRWRPERKFDLGLPITVFGGDADRDIPFDHLQAWSAYTTSATEVVLHPGGHFFLHARYQEMARMIRCRLMDTDDGLKSLVAASVERERWSSTAVGALVPTGSEEEERYLIRWRSAVEAGSKVATAMSQGQAQRLRTQLRTLNELAGIIVDNALQSLGLFEGTEVLTAEEISSRSMVIEGQKRALCRLIAIAIETGLLVSQVDGHYVRCRPWRDKLSALDLALMREDFAENTDLFDFVCSFGCALPDILTGRVHPAEMLFRDGLINVATRLYCDSPPFRYCNAVASAVMNSFTQATTSDADLHVVEIGAGTGATTKAILCGMNSGIGRFLFTDVSNFFLVDAKRAFCDLTFVDYELLDIEKPPQEKLHNSFDIAVAAHVLHATRRIHETLSHVRSLLKAGGTLILLEETSMQAFFSVTMGTQTGFDRFDDMPLRINHPLLSAEHWEDQALRAGFRRFAAFPEVMGIRPMLIQA